jgi:hypothetical protein
MFPDEFVVERRGKNGFVPIEQRSELWQWTAHGHT